MLGRKAERGRGLYGGGEGTAVLTRVVSGDLPSKVIVKKATVSEKRRFGENEV